MSVIIEPMHSEYVLQAVSKPKLTSTNSFLRSPSIVLGHPTTHIFEPWERKYSARRAAFVFESSPPITTNPSSFRDSQYFRDF